jgi:hypothetical protein
MVRRDCGLRQALGGETLDLGRDLPALNRDLSLRLRSHSLGADNLGQDSDRNLS